MRTGPLLNLAAGIALARAGAGGGSRNSGAIHPFAKYKSLAMGADAADATTTAPTPTPTPTRPALECFQVAEPVLTPSGVTRRDLSQLPALASADQVPIEAADERGGSLAPCTVVLMEHTFANSYGFPFVGMHGSPSLQLSCEDSTP